MGKEKKEEFNEKYRRLLITASECYLINVIREVEGESRGVYKNLSLKYYNDVLTLKSKLNG